ncbi:MULTISPECIES: chromosomal replication initiator protein DnaA [Prevotellaceae]|jgi:chromosomal replication initiator protein dnaA|uniref:Chromosomal replication initiator protein DnaA n=2 Tax=Segatella oris TaxID=28135 RepID=D1QNG4_9BACT|nr:MULTISPECIES: chromosomal replication initiator protein DnaA [Prevotellaceae]EFB33221.1 chromosomal replication initiator protein DnaA [Segatella oris F0302]MBF1448359.1 chromosomal replication initiator protein DnaA [Segatella oris]OFO73230.1 chromosomal replication initiator protein DnaA [Prevotella sp. HMSC077E08]OFP57757.1 chromosomal replication initiator protein DnaA [Prevotella sp. HMSC077E09]VEH16219.1 Chromosomal replication initiator protein DnaA [Segatella oris]
MKVSPDNRWGKSLALIRQNVTQQQFETWFKPIVFEHYNEATKTILVQVPSLFVYEYLEENFLNLLKTVLYRSFGEGAQLTYRVVTDKEHKLTQDLEADPTDAEPRKERSGANQSPSPMDVDKAADIDTQLDPHLNFKNYVEGTSNKLARSLGLSIAEHPSQPQFNPMFIYGPSGCGKTHLINAIGLRCKQLYPEKRVLYISARLFQSQFVDANLHSSINDFIRFYQTIDMLIVDDIQEWVNATKTQDTFFHIFNHLFRNGKRILLVSDRPPVDLKGMNERLLTRFSCGLIAELEKPNVELCTDILKAKIRRDGLHIPDEVIRFIASTANGSVRDLEGVVNSLLAYSVVYNSNVDMRLAERVIKRAVKVDDNPLTVDEILDTVCNHFSVTLSAVNSKSRKHDLVIARQVTMYLAQKYTKMPASRIGRLVGNRDHSTVIHSCAQVENRLKVDSSFKEEVNSIEVSFKLKS